MNQELQPATLPPHQTTTRDFVAVLFRRKLVILGLFAVTTITVLAVSLTTLLRRVALARRTRAEVAALHGEPWIAFLTQDPKRRVDASHVVRDLIQTAYRGERSAAGEPQEWLAFARSWIREVA